MIHTSKPIKYIYANAVFHLVQAAIQHHALTVFHKLWPVSCPLQQWVACSVLACAVCLHPWRSAVCESDLASQFVLDWAEANYGAVMS